MIPDMDLFLAHLLSLVIFYNSTSTGTTLAASINILTSLRPMCPLYKFFSFNMRLIFSCKSKGSALDTLSTVSMPISCKIHAKVVPLDS